MTGYTGVEADRVSFCFVLFFSLLFYLMLYSLYKDAYISQLVRVMDPVLKDRTSFKQIKRADGLRGCGLNNIHIFDNGSNQIQWKELDFSGLSALKAPNCQN